MGNSAQTGRQTPLWQYFIKNQNLEKQYICMIQHEVQKGRDQSSVAEHMVYMYYVPYSITGTFRKGQEILKSCCQRRPGFFKLWVRPYQVGYKQISGGSSFVSIFLITLMCHYDGMRLHLRKCYRAVLLRGYFIYALK